MTERKSTTSNYAPSKMPTRHIGAAPTPSGLSPVSSSWSNAAIGLPDVLQSYAQNRRSGTLVVYRAQQPHFLGLRQGAIVFLTGTPPGSLLRALVWTGALSVAEVESLQQRLPNDDAAAARELLDEEVVDVEAVKDALTVLVEETFHEAFLEQTPEWDLAAEEPEDDWARVQENIGLAIAISGLLMELMRTRDELQGLAGSLCDAYDLPLVSRQREGEDQLSDDMARIYALADGQRPAWRVIIDSWLIPSHGRMALALLFDGGWLRLAEAEQLLQQADHNVTAGREEDALGFYRRALDMGLQQPRARYEMARLLAANSQQREAAAAYLQSAAELESSNPEQAIAAYRAASALDTEVPRCLRREAALQVQLGRPQDAAAAMWKLIDHLEAEADYTQALRTFPEVAEYEHNRVRLLSRQGDLAQAAGDYQKALLAWDELEHLLDPERDRETLGKVHARILAIDPGRCDTALHHARQIYADGQGDADAAAEIIRAALAAAGTQVDPDLAIACHELLAQVDSSDAENRRWLARSYRSREDRKGAIDQLQMLVTTHQRSKNRSGLVDALRELVDIDPLRVEAVRQLSALYIEDDAQEAAVGVWRQTIEAALAKGDARQAVALAEEAVALLPMAVPLRLLLVKSANRRGHKDSAVEHCLAAAQLARLAGKIPLAKQCLRQVLPAIGDQVVVHAQWIELLSESADEDLPEHLGPACEVALKTGNYGLAVEWARRWVALSEESAIQPRQRLIEAYLRAGQHVEAQASAEHLADDLVGLGQREEAHNLLLHMTQRYPRSSNLLTMLARVQRDLGKKRHAAQSFHSLIQLLQQEQRVKEAEALVKELARLVGDGEVTQRIRKQLADGQAVTW